MAAPGTSSVPAPTAGNAEKLEIAKRLALRINAQKNLGIESQVLSTLFQVLYYSSFFLLFITVLTWGYLNTGMWCLPRLIHMNMLVLPTLWQSTFPLAYAYNVVACWELHSFFVTVLGPYPIVLSGY